MSDNATNNVLHPTAASFDAEVMGSDQPVLVDFWAPWCPPCRMLKPEVEKLAGELAGRARVAVINVDEQPELAERFGVSSIPALMVVSGGEVQEAWAGYTPRPALLAKLEPHMAK